MRGFDELSSLSRDDLSTLWTEHFGTQPPKKMRSNTLARILSCEEQWVHSAESRAKIRKQLERVAVRQNQKGETATEGSRIVREWHGAEHVVDVLDGAYHWNGRSWSSLSAIAKEITGTKWSGPRFFGVKA